MKSGEAVFKIPAALDRFGEAHFWIHGMERFYHDADPFRWHLNAFLRSLKEIPQLLAMELQSEAGFAEWYQVRRCELGKDPLVARLRKDRDFVVHRGMLLPASSGYIGVTEGRGLKLGMGQPIHPLEDSDAAMDRFLEAIAVAGDVLGILHDDEESLPCVYREWKLEPFEADTLEVCAQAWLRVGDLIAQTLRWFGAKPPPLDLECRHSSQDVQFKMYDREELRKRMRSFMVNGHA